MKLSELIHQDFPSKNDLNCAESILYGANQIYNLGLDKEDLKLAAGFGGGMGIEDTCGALTGSVMVLGAMFTEGRGHTSPRVKELCVKLLETFRGRMGDIKCTPLKAKYRNDEIKCRLVIEKAAQILEELIAQEKGRTR